MLQLELISIHPFNDGNGRTSRALSEDFIEKHGYVPFTPYSTKHKRSYQIAMGNFSLKSLDNIIDAYLDFGKYVLQNYQGNVSDLLNSIDKLTIAINNFENRNQD